MTNKKKEIVIPKYYRPRPYQAEAWRRRYSGKYNVYFCLWCRQAGKDTNDIEYAQDFNWWNRGIQSVYIGLDNVWIKENIWKKTIRDENANERTHWSNYPDELIEVRPTEREVLYLNDTDINGKPFEENLAPSRLKFIGFLNDQQLIGSSYRLWTISEASLYKDDAWAHIQPIWENQEAEGLPFMININGTPRGIRNIYYDMLSTYTKETDPEAFPGEHGNVYVDKKTIHDLIIPDGQGGWKKLYSDERIEQLKDRIQRQYGNLNLYYQEYECDFLTVKAGLVYQAIEQLAREERIRNFNPRIDKPMYMAWDIASKGKSTDASSCIIFQYIDHQMMVYDYYEERGKALVECVADIATKEYFKYITFAALPWDSERSASSETPLEEAQRIYPHINWHALSKDSVERGITLVRRQLPNMVIHETNCSRLVDAFMNYEYTFVDRNNDWSPKPKHNWASHAMDAMRYACMAIGEMSYLQLNSDGSAPEIDPSYDTLDSMDVERPKYSIISREFDYDIEDGSFYD